MRLAFRLLNTNPVRLRPFQESKNDTARKRIRIRVACRIENRERESALRYSAATEQDSTAEKKQHRTAN